MSEENGFAPAWRPEPGEEIEGKVEVVDARESEYGVYPILTLETPGGAQAVHCVHSILRREIARRYEPKQMIGQLIKVRYDGKKSTADGKRSYHAYTVFGGNRESAYDWSQDLPEDERQAVEALAEPPIAPSEPFTPSPAFQPQPAPTGEQYGEEPPF